MAKYRAFRVSRWSLAFCASLSACLWSPVRAEEWGEGLVSPDTFTVYGDVRAVAADGEVAWTNDAFGKLRYGGDEPALASDLRIQPVFGEAGIVWQPRFGWALSGTVVALAQGGDFSDGKPDAGLSEAYVSFKPLGGGPVRFSARAGLMWPPVSLEHSGPEWAVTETVTPSAINSWIGEEVKVVGLELTGKAALGDHSLEFTLAGFDVNDTAGALVSLRGWALHDRKALAFRIHPLPQLNEFITQDQPRFSHPIMDLDSGTFTSPGYYVRLAWDLPEVLHLEAIHYDNNGSPLAENFEHEWGWRTKFDAVGLVADLSPDWHLRAQALTGRALMGEDEGNGIWVDTRFRAAYAMITRKLASGSLSARLDLFGTRNRGGTLLADDDEDGWAVTVAARREFGRSFTALLEFLRVESRRAARARAILEPNQAQNQLQLVLRARW